MLMDFFDCHGIVHHEFAPEGQTVNAAFYMEVMKRLREIVCVACDRNWAGVAVDSPPRQCPRTLCINPLALKLDI